MDIFPEMSCKNAYDDDDVVAVRDVDARNAAAEILMVFAVE